MENAAGGRSVIVIDDMMVEIEQGKLNIRDLLANTRPLKTDIIAITQSLLAQKGHIESTRRQCFACITDASSLHELSQSVSFRGPYRTAAEFMDDARKITCVDSPTTRQMVVVLRCPPLNTSIFRVITVHLTRPSQQSLLDDLMSTKKDLVIEQFRKHLPDFDKVYGEMVVQEVMLAGSSTGQIGDFYMSYRYAENLNELITHVKTMLPEVPSSSVFKEKKIAEIELVAKMNLIAKKGELGSVDADDDAASTVAAIPGGDCTICLMHCTNLVFINRCGHMFGHEGCMKMANEVNKKCAICREQVHEDDPQPLSVEMKDAIQFVEETELIEAVSVGVTEEWEVGDGGCCLRCDLVLTEDDMQISLQRGIRICENCDDEDQETDVIEADVEAAEAAIATGLHIEEPALAPTVSVS
jgi:hypothetical protein